MRNSVKVGDSSPAVGWQRRLSPMLIFNLGCHTEVVRPKDLLFKFL
ncbi:hypothetical protein SULYE_0888 [Sulfurihydrogenibium yellowstonense SS-5]|uniref:Uncharacterized protein n=1 Tax=Sulfurihydrogenibium yellowstonense SS-5 TaxID=432331 RepID=C4FJY8_9AQUI|nr:hypothetical protein SULYE_0888 [Sulfurihydrogenibium yellowstonense SS-5]